MSAAPAAKSKRIMPGKISPMRSVPTEIGRPDYAESGRPKRSNDKNLIKTDEEIERMRLSGAAARRVLEKVGAAVKPGISTEALDEIAHQAYIDEGGYPSPLNYRGYPKSICTSVNEVICHGIPDDRILEDGDIVNCDITIYLDGMHGDCSETFLVGDVAPEVKQLVSATEEALYRGIATVYHGSRLNEIGRAIEQYILPQGFSIVRDFVGHGIGSSFHIEPQVPHYFSPRADMVLQAGMCFTIEPMINMGAAAHHLWSDNWTAVTVDYKHSAQFEHTLLVTDEGVEILTLAASQPQRYLHNKPR